ncbi:MAG: tyrosine-protein phosphatase [SAR202 cluster bacterium]|nr:tyrosine-protein phosphatase [SAR202 cluster bacterium]MDP7103292.1 tyrosine-protein phosphatase [SAR202 cluster bacterium]MDP7412736.1 tyrosine-protein phosphatase [SAR202 cluster bacterium]
MADTPIDRSIAFEAIDNFRDLSGLVTRDGQTIRRGRVFRSGDPRDMTRSDYAKLTDDLGLRTILDFRRLDELETKGISPLIKPPVQHRNIELVRLDGPDVVALEARSAGNLGKVYEGSVANTGFGQRLVAGLEVIADLENHSLVFHCSLGKDRAGLFAAILLATLGVTDDDIASDYALSDESGRRQLENEMAEVGDVEQSRSMPEWVYRAAPESILHAMAFARREHGSVERYLRARGADATLPDRLRRALLD